MSTSNHEADSLTIECPFESITFDGEEYFSLKIPDNFFKLINIKPGDAIVWKQTGDHVTAELKRS